VAPRLVNDIVRRLPPEILTVGVFRDEAPQRVVEIMNRTGLRAAQLHGHETVEQVQQVEAGRAGRVSRRRCGRPIGAPGPQLCSTAHRSIFSTRVFTSILSAWSPWTPALTNTLSWLT
jgi:hypothetical protein